uniref:Uncharacterized protein n=1 Tax=Solanum lycopersicum TaxID=4081 RepID=A0A3Q7EI85_SOLLC
MFLQEFVMMKTSQNHQLKTPKRNHHQKLQFLFLTSLSTHKFRVCSINNFLHYQVIQIISTKLVNFTKNIEIQVAVIAS